MGRGSNKTNRSELQLKNHRIVVDLLNEFSIIQERLSKLNIEINISSNSKEIELHHPLATGVYWLEDSDSIIYGINSTKYEKYILGFEDFFDKFCDAVLVDWETANLKESVYSDRRDLDALDSNLNLKGFNNEMMRFLAKNPKYLFEMSPRKFEQLTEKILIDFGFETQLTPSTRDGGKDILAWIRNDITSILTFVECKRYSPKNPVGVNVVREVYGVQKIFRANKSLIISTSRFTKGALEAAGLISSEVELKDYSDIVKWLRRYASD